MKRLVLLAALCVAGPLAAQTGAPQAPAPQPTPAAQTAAPQPERGPLILDLDENARRQILSGSRSNETSGRGEALPSLGGDARKIDPAMLRGGSPFPKESQSDRQTPY